MYTKVYYFDLKKVYYVDDGNNDAIFMGKQKRSSIMGESRSSLSRVYITLSTIF